MKYIFTLTLALISTFIFSQDFYDLSTIQTIEISFEESNWDQLLDAQKAGDGEYILAQSATINGIVFDSVGVKYKGNSSYNANQVKNPFHIELDTYKDHEYDGYTDIKLANGKGDPTFVRDVLGFQIIRQYMDAPLSNYANLYVNGTLIGLYTNTESISKKFVENRFGSKKNAFFDCSPPAGAGPTSNDFPSLEYLGQDSTAYYDSYDIKSDQGWNEFIDFCDTLTNNIADIEKILDVDKALWMLAFDNVIVNLDSYIGAFKQNYYLYRSDFDQFIPIVWDLNESFGVFAQTGSTNLNTTAAKQQMDHLLHDSDSDYPLIQQLLSVPMYKRMYLAHFKTILLENFDNGSYYTAALGFQATIDASVQADVNKLFTYDDFTTNLTSDLSSGGGPGGGPGGGQGTSTTGLTSLMDGRSTYLLGLSDFNQTEPSITSIALSNTAPTIGETITVSANITDETTVYLGYREAQTGPFVRVQMFDDGAHNDAFANDGIYGVNLNIDFAETQYYIYAENTNAGKFSPVRAEYEYHEIAASSVTPPLGDLVINEFMASNDSTVVDQDGDYDDWIELYNNSDTEIDLTGFFLSDDIDELTLWDFPSGTSIAANSYLIVWADKDDDQVGLHADFKLGSSGETIYLLAADETMLDSILYLDQCGDVSYGREPNGTGDFNSMEPTFNAENQGVACDDGDDCTEGDVYTSDCNCEGTLIDVNNDGICDTDNTIYITPPLGDLVINEFMASNDSTVVDQDGDYDDWIELYNNSTTDIDLSGFFLSDDLADLTLWDFPAGTSIPANSYLIVWADKDEDQVGLHADFKLGASGETIYLLAADQTMLDSIPYLEQCDDVSYGRAPNGTGNFNSMGATFNAENQGIACDDGDECTTGDVYTSDCMCAGIFADADNDGICDAEDDCSDSQVGTACDDGNACTTGDVYDTDCNCIGTFTDTDNDGICDADDDCPSLDNSLIGTACDDGDICTVGDVYTADCNCIGTFADADNDGICDAEDDCESSQIGTACNDGDVCTTGDVFDADCNCIGTFTDTDDDGICDANDDCPDFNDSLIGTACDDGDVCTEGDVYTTDCNCTGTLVDVNNDGICDTDIDNDGFFNFEDCDDNDPNINPGQTEQPYNGLDDDCDTSTFDDDLDQDGFLSIDDCDDNNPNINPDQIEEPYNGIDDDCNPNTLDDDLDQDGFGLAEDCDDENPNINPEAEDIPNNDIDENCDGMDFVSSIHQITNTNINIYPNPASDVIRIEIEGQLNFTASLYDLEGKLIKRENNAIQIAISSIPMGIYLLEIKDLSSGQKIIERIVIEK